MKLYYDQPHLSMCASIGFVNWKSFIKKTPLLCSSHRNNPLTTEPMGVWIRNSALLVFLLCICQPLHTVCRHMLKCCRSYSVTQASCCDAKPPNWFMSHQWLLVTHSGQTLKSAQRAKQRRTLIPVKMGFKSSSIPTKLSPERDPATRNTKKMHAQIKRALNN